MADVHSKAQRSYNMSQIKGKNTRPEMIVRKFLHANGFRYRLHDRKLPGRPDIVLPKYKTVIFINGCFWHGHKEGKCYIVPKTRTEWWKNKIGLNVGRDRKKQKALRELGWNVLYIWECELKVPKRELSLAKLLSKLS